MTDTFKMLEKMQEFQIDKFEPESFVPKNMSKLTSPGITSIDMDNDYLYEKKKEHDLLQDDKKEKSYLAKNFIWSYLF